jgi:hypothetical protein
MDKTYTIIVTDIKGAVVSTSKFSTFALSEFNKLRSVLDAGGTVTIKRDNPLVPEREEDNRL